MTIQTGKIVSSRFVFHEFLYDDAVKDHIADVLLEIEHYLRNAKKFFKNHAGDTTTVGVVQFRQKQFVVKRYNFRNFWHAVKLQFRVSHAYKSYWFAHYLNQHAITAIRPVAVIQKKILFTKQASFFISEYEATGISGCLFFSNQSQSKTDWVKAIDLIFELIKKLKDYKICHGDFHFGNLLIVDNNPVLLDFDRIKKIKNAKRFHELHRKDLSNFYRYLVNNKEAYQAFKRHPAFQQNFGFCCKQD